MSSVEPSSVPIWMERVRPSCVTEPAAAYGSEIAAISRDYGVAMADDAVFVLDGDGVVRFAHRPEGALGGSLGAALAVGILDAQEVLAAAVPAEQEVEQRGAGATDMQQSRRAGGEARADGGGHGVHVSRRAGT